MTPQGLLQKLVGMERNEQFADGILPKIHISGCPSSCGTHQIGVIGFRGGAKTIDKVLKPAFNLYINGSDIQGQERMGEEVGTLLEEQIPDFLCALGHAVSDSEWILTHGLQKIRKASRPLQLLSWYKRLFI